MSDLFDDKQTSHQLNQPLAERLRPTSLSDVIGQEHLLGPDGALRQLLDTGHLASLIFWGPPGTGKTTVARLLANESTRTFVQISAIFSGVGELKKVFEAAKLRKNQGRDTLLFVDEIHRFNKAQQDAFLPVVEDGTLVLIGATTENPSFELNGALLSRTRVLNFVRLENKALLELLGHAEAALDITLPITDEARTVLCTLADGDGRTLLTMLEDLLAMGKSSDEPMNAEMLLKRINKRAPLYDKGQDGHYNFISALHKSVRGSDPDAALYYTGRMLEAGEPPLYILRRLVRMANEDIGLADPRAVEICLAAKEAFDFLGSPEGELAIFQAAVYLALAPKSNAIYKAEKATRAFIAKTGSCLPPKIILNAPTKLMKNEGYGEGYLYDHDQKDAFSGQNYFPDGLERPQLYSPTDFGLEARIKERFEALKQKRAQRKAASTKTVGS